MKKNISVTILILFFIISTGAYIFGVADYFMPADAGSSARMIRIGNIEGFSESADSVFENPAGLYNVKNISVGMFTTTFMDEVDYINMSLAYRTPFGTFGAGYMSAGVKDFAKTFINPAKGDEIDISGYFNSENATGKLSYQVSQTDNLHIGVSGVYYANNIDHVKGKGFNFDAGVIFDADDLKLSVVIKNIATSLKIKYTSESVATYNQIENIPLKTVYSAMYKAGDLSIYGQIKQGGNNKELTKSFGVNYRPSFIPLISVSGGYKEYVVIREVKGNLVFGVGLDLIGVSFDYAYESSEHVLYNHKHYFSVGLSL